MTTATFWDKAAPKYAQKPIEDVPAYEATLERVRSFLHADDHILEIGCGTGGTALALSPAVAHVTATDISARMVAIAHSKLGKTGPRNVRFLQAKALASMQSAPYDVVCGFNILHLLEDLPKTFSHLKTQVKPGGFIITKTPCLGEMNIALRFVVRMMQLVGKAPFVNYFSIAELEQAHRDAGLDIIETGFFGKAQTSRFVVARRT